MMEQVIDWFGILAPWLALFSAAYFNNDAFGQLEDVSGCNGEVRVSIDENGWLILRGPYREHLEVQNWIIE